MKSIGIAVFIITISGTAGAQSIGAVAKAERQRQHELVPAKVIKKEVNPQTQSEPPEKSTTVEDPKTTELAELDREKAGLLMKLKEVIHDRKAVQDIEQRLAEIQKRSDELKREAASKTTSKADNKEK